MPKKGPSTWIDYTIGSFVILVFLVTIFMNALALHYTYTKIRKPSIKKIPHLFVGALSVSGLGIALFQYPPFIASRFSGVWTYSSGVCSFVAFVVLLFGTLTISLVVLMSLERLTAIVFPFYYNEHATFRKSVIALLGVIFYSVCIASLSLVLNHVQLNVSTGVCTYTMDSYNCNTRAVVYIIVSHYIVSLTAMFVSNITVLHAVHKLDRKSVSDEYSKNQCEGKKDEAKSSACVNFAKMVGILSLCYSVCWTVILIRILLIYVYNWHNQYYDQLVLVLTSIDPLINHFVCLWVMRKYRDGYMTAIAQLFKCLTPGEDSVVMTAFTRISSFSRRSSRSFRKSSTSRPNRQPVYYKQVPQSLETNKHADLIPSPDDENLRLKDEQPPNDDGSPIAEPEQAISGQHK